jgi:hypothetical protein
MAYMNQERKAKFVSKIKAILEKHKMKGSLSVQNRSAIQLTLTSGPLFSDGYHNVNVYHFDKSYAGKERDFISECLDVLNEGNWDNSDAMTDYFDVGWYVYISVGKWNKHYVKTK